MGTMIQVKYEGRTGNQLFQFAMAAVLSRMTDVPFFAPAIPGFPGTKGFWPPPSTLEKTGRMPGRYHSAMNLNTLAEIAKSEGLIVNGWPHNAGFFQPHKAWLVTMLAPEGGAFVESEATDVVLHLRLGDYFHGGNAKWFGYPVESIYKLLAQLSYTRCLIVTDSPKHDWIQRIVTEFRGRLAASTDRVTDYRTLYHGRSVIVTPSTFGWWASWSGQAQQIYLAHAMGGWRHRPGRNAFLPEDSRYASFDAEGRIIRPS